MSYDPIYALAASSAYNLNERKQIGGYFYLDNFSNDEIAVYRNPMKKEFIIASRGTEFDSFGSTIKDLFSDTLIAFNLEKIDPRLHSLEDKIKLLKNKYYDHEIVLTGHSLGGRLSMEAARDLDLSAIVFNPGSGPYDILMGDQWDDDIEIYRTEGDFVSSFVRDEAEIVPTKPGKGSHDMGQFLRRKAIKK